MWFHTLLSPCTNSPLCAGILSDVLSLILNRLKGSSIVKMSSDHEQKVKTAEEQAKEKLSQKAHQFLTAFAWLVPS